jgi:ankyrin repeat protein
VKSTIQRVLDVSSRYFNLIPESFDIALQIAADRGHLHIVELLLKVDGININFRGGALPLFLAAKGGHSAVVELLLAANDVDPNVGDRHSTTPLCLACQKGHVSVVRQLLARDDVDFNIIGYGRKTKICNTIDSCLSTWPCQRISC